MWPSSESFWGSFLEMVHRASRVTSIEQRGLMQQFLSLVRTFSWLISQLFLILRVACAHAFILVFFLLAHFYVQLYMLDNTTLFPMALFSLKVFFFLGLNCVSKLQSCVILFVMLNNWRGGGAELYRYRYTGRLLQMARTAEELAWVAEMLRLRGEQRCQPAWDECKFAAGE